MACIVRKVDNAIHWIYHYPVNSTICFVNTYPLDSDLSGGEHYPAYERLGSCCFPNIYIFISIYTGFTPFFKKRFPVLFQNFSRTKTDFFQDSKIHINPFHFQDLKFSLLSGIHIIFSPRVINPLTPGTFCQNCFFSDILVVLKLDPRQISFSLVENALVTRQLTVLATRIAFKRFWPRHAQKSKFWESGLRL